MHQHAVVVFDHAGYWRYVGRGLGALDAVELAKHWSERGERGEDVDKVLITDADDFTNFSWERGRGVVYPPREGG